MLFEQQQELNFRIHSRRQEKLTSSFVVNTSKNAESESTNLKSSTLLSYVSLPNLWKSLKLSPDIHKVTSSRGDVEARPSCHKSVLQMNVLSFQVRWGLHNPGINREKQLMCCFIVEADSLYRYLIVSM